MNKKPTLNQMITRLRYFIKHMNYQKAHQQTQAILKNLDIALTFQQQRKDYQNSLPKTQTDKSVLDAYTT